MKISDNLKAHLMGIIDEFEKEEESVRDRQIMTWKKMDYYWRGIQRIYWNDVAHDYRVFGQDDNFDINEQIYYDKPVNIFQALLESVMAALSVNVPGVRFLPDDAENNLDVSTAKGANKIAEQLYKYNEAPLLWIRGLWVYCTQGFMAAYNYTDEDEKYGTVEEDETKDVDEIENVHTCPECEYEFDTDEFVDENGNVETPAEKDEFDPRHCPQCEKEVVPVETERVFTVTKIVGKTTKPKSRQRIIIEGGLFVRIPNYARNQEDTPYVAYEYETHYTNVLKRWEHLRGKIDQSSSMYDYGRWGRLSTQYQGEYPMNTPTVREWWLRPSVLFAIEDDDLRKEAMKAFPDGAKICLVNDTWAEGYNESLDDHWTISFNPRSNYLIFDPLGLLLVSMQDIVNDLVSLSMQTIEHGIPQTFADPKVLNFEEYKNTEPSPGQIYPAKSKGGGSIGDGFFSLQTAELSRDVPQFADKMQEYAQLTSGASPALWGGQIAPSVRTSGQYEQARNQSMQRLSITWKMINSWWKQIFGKAVPAYIKDMVDDERIVTEENGSYINNVIKRADVQGRLGDVSTEASDDIPLSTGQKREAIISLLQTEVPAILNALTSPENFPIISQIVGVDELKLPGYDDVNKQYWEIQELLKSQPIPGEPGPDGQPTVIPSIEPDFDVDNHPVEAAICKSWLVSDAGINAKIDNEAGYENIKAHMKMHIEMAQVQQQMAMQAQVQNQPQPTPEGGQ